MLIGTANLATTLTKPTRNVDESLGKNGAAWRMREVATRLLAFVPKLARRLHWVHKLAIRIDTVGEKFAYHRRLRSNSIVRVIANGILTHLLEFAGNDWMDVSALRTFAAVGEILAHLGRMIELAGVSCSAIRKIGTLDQRFSLNFHQIMGRNSGIHINNWSIKMTFTRK
jgi:hypothetical protein